MLKNMKKKETTGTMPVCSMINLDDLHIAKYTHLKDGDTSYQRNVKNSKVTLIANNFDPDIIGIILVSYRDGKYYIIDGQHRVQALKRIGRKTVLCQVLTDLTYEEEAEKFAKLNSNRVSLTAVNKFNAMVEAKNTTSLSIVNSMNKYGFDCPRRTASTDDNLIGAISKIQKIYNKRGKEHFEKMLKFMRICWNGCKTSLQSSILSAMSVFLYNHGKEIDEDVFVQAMKDVTPDELLMQAAIYRKSPIKAMRDESSVSCIVKVMEDLYNIRANKRRLPMLANDFC